VPGETSSNNQAVNVLLTQHSTILYGGRREKMKPNPLSLASISPGCFSFLKNTGWERRKKFRKDSNRYHGKTSKW
jgi:hypothetical protein